MKDSFMTVMQDALIQIGSELFELERVNGDTMTSRVFVMKDETIVLFEHRDNGEHSITTYRKDGPNNIEALFSRLDLLWRRPEHSTHGPSSWEECPNHIALIKRLIAIDPNSVFSDLEYRIKYLEQASIT